MMVPTAEIIHDVYPDGLDYQHQVSHVKNNVVNTLPISGVHNAGNTHDVYPGVLDSRQQVSRCQNGVTNTFPSACAKPAILTGLNEDATSLVVKDSNLVRLYKYSSIG
jgi:hypothetical protein